jgi:hypothetical protein
MLVGTFHKTGTMLIFTIFRRISRDLGYRLSVPSRRPPIEDWDIFLDSHARFPAGPLPATARGVVVIRDPRDVIISGAHYHARLRPGPPEAWAHVPRPQFGGLTYQQQIAALPDDEARLSFEMDRMGARTLRLMARFVTLPPGFVAIRFEDLVTDPGMAAYRRMFDWLGLRAADRGAALRIAEANSLFSGRLVSPHVRSGRPEQWREHFTPALHEKFRRKFGTLAEDLGYPRA